MQSREFGGSVGERSFGDPCIQISAAVAHARPTNSDEARPAPFGTPSPARSQSDTQELAHLRVTEEFVWLDHLV
jgi:hypothetical protein